MPLTEGQRPLGLIAGGGQFPLLICRAAHQAGLRVIVTALNGDADPALAEEADECHWFTLGQLGAIVKPLKKAGVDHAVMAGTVSKPNLFAGQLKPDLMMIKAVLPKIGRVHDDALLRLVAEAIKAEGIDIIESTAFLPMLLAPRGRLTKRRPTRREKADAVYGFELARDLGRHDIGQCLVVRSRAVLAVEAMEGTDETIRRGGRLGGGRAVVVKVAKPGQDLRFDLPSVGLTTVQTMLQAGCSALIIEAGRTIFFDRAEAVALADRNGLAVLALEAGRDLEEQVR